MHKAYSEYYIFQYFSRKKKKRFKFLLFNLSSPFVRFNENDCQKNEFNVLLCDEQENITR